MWLADQGYSTGWSDKTFRPKEYIRRDAVAAFIYRYVSKNFIYRYVPDNGTLKDLPIKTFRDVPPAHKFYKEISAMGGIGVIKGFSDGTFRPDAYVTRAAVAAFLYRLSEVSMYRPHATPVFSDVAPSYQFYTEIDWLKDAYITAGWADGTFRSETYITREAVAAFLYRYDSYTHNARMEKYPSWISYPTEVKNLSTPSGDLKSNSGVILKAPVTTNPISGNKNSVQQAAFIEY